MPYVRSRHLADEAVRALANADFKVCSINAPFVVGAVSGLKETALPGYVRGDIQRAIGEVVSQYRA
ncbi:hypothetical protein ACN1C3_30635 [Pseudomonas sp. H11T01]|uniref:hypothetical protein n=1 Tax=Pseudomonas sp. H11T01 TaxID=3402749 RepID=UPI003AC1C515